MKRRVAVLSMCFMLAAGQTSGALAAENTVEIRNSQFENVVVPYYVAICTYSGHITSRGTTISLSVSVDCKKEEKISITMELQKKNSNGTWETEKTWNKSFRKSIATAKETYSGSKGCTYRLKYTVKAGTDKKSGTTSKVKL